ncbi:unnamed protein product [Penicillium salamii]|nr:unnamed protein product [Penicillium salamii]
MDLTDTPTKYPGDSLREYYRNGIGTTSSDGNFKHHYDGRLYTCPSSIMIELFVVEQQFRCQIQLRDRLLEKSAEAVDSKEISSCIHGGEIRDAGLQEITQACVEGERTLYQRTRVAVASWGNLPLRQKRSSMVSRSKANS